MIQPLAWAKTFFRLSDEDVFNLLLYLWAIVIVAVLEENVSEWYKLHCTIIQFLLDGVCIYKYFFILSYVEFFELIEIFAFLILDKEKTAHPKTFNHPILFCLFASHNHIEPLLADGEGQYFLFHPYTSSQSVARIYSVGIAATPKENILDTHVLYDIV